MVSRVQRRNDLHVRDHKNLNMYIFNRKNWMKIEKLRMKHIKYSTKPRYSQNQTYIGIAGQWSVDDICKENILR